jgi:superfamily I DNA/RNA helicase
MPFPTPRGRQREVAYLPDRGHTVVLGSAGSGKTTMAILRARYLAELLRSPNEYVLLVTFNRALVTYLNAVSQELPRRPRIEVRNYHHFARGYLGSMQRLGVRDIVDSREREALIAQAVAAVQQHAPGELIWRYPTAFFVEESAWIARLGIADAQTYYDVRHPHHPQLTQSSSAAVLAVLNHYRALRAASGYRYDWDDIATVVEGTLAEDARPRRYRHVIIDEGQDFSPAMLRSLAAAIPPTGSLTFFGDMAQQIYGSRISWKDAGLQIHEPERFSENYRNSSQIARLCLAMTETPAFRGVADLVPPNEPRAAGPLPAIVRCRSIEDEIALAVRQARAAGSNQSVAILLPRRDEEQRIINAIGRVQRLHRELTTWSSTGISVGTIHAAKGLEFDTVILPFCSADRLPNPERLEGFANRDDGIAQEARLLYVGMSRARSGLILTYTGQPTPLLPPNNGLYQHTER